MFDQIEKLKHDFTDKLVKVDDHRPELARFRGQTGTIKTINMSGRALVQFEANNNIGWYDIELDYLQVIDQPLPKQEAAAERPKPAQAPAEAKAKPAPAAKPAAKPAAGAKPAGGKSVAEILAAARAEKAAGGGAAPVAGGKPSDSPAAEKPTPAPKADKPKPAGGKLSPAEIIAQLRQQDKTK